MTTIPVIKGTLSATKKVLLMLHGRGATAEDILGLADYLPVKDFTLIAPQAEGHTWYPYSFIAPSPQNEPYLSNSLAQISTILEQLQLHKIPPERTFFLGFSQGACLALEFTARNAEKWGGIIAFTGGLIGEKIVKENYRGNFKGCPVYLGSSDPDPHVSLERVRETEELLKIMGASIQTQIFKNMGHTVIKQELEAASKILSL